MVNKMTYEINKEKPIKIEFNYHARGFYCPTCSTGVANKNQKCPFCGQQLLDAYGFDKSHTSTNYEEVYDYGYDTAGNYHMYGTFSGHTVIKSK